MGADEFRADEWAEEWADDSSQERHAASSLARLCLPAFVCLKFVCPFVCGGSARVRPGSDPRNSLLDRTLYGFRSRFQPLHCSFRPRHCTKTDGLPRRNCLVTSEADGLLRLWDLRRIRQQLATLKLDWDAPLGEPEKPFASEKPLKVTVDLAEAPAGQ